MEIRTVSFSTVQCAWESRPNKSRILIAFLFFFPSFRIFSSHIRRFIIIHILMNLNPILRFTLFYSSSNHYVLLGGDLHIRPTFQGPREWVFWRVESFGFGDLGFGFSPRGCADLYRYLRSAQATLPKDPDPFAWLTKSPAQAPLQLPNPS